uniref:Uncharacterized protein n=1 Tax=Rhizophora mucronata TaxID=61149 RepID=A0A2P2IRV1_RHIMU
MWLLVAKMKKLGNTEVMSSEVVNPSSSSRAGLRNGSLPSNGHSYRISEDEICENIDSINTFEEIKATYQKEKSQCRELESLILRLKGEDIAGLDIMALEELQNFHVEAITKICQAKVQSTVQTW